jgi:hypothetical protein
MGLSQARSAGEVVWRAGHHGEQVSDSGQGGGRAGHDRRPVAEVERLHGFVSLEIAGNYASMSIDPDEVFEIQLATLAA